MMIANYEKQALREIEAWESHQPSIVESLIDDLGSPVKTAIGRIPDPAKEAVTGALSGFFRVLHNASYWTFSDKRILSQARKAGMPVYSVSDLAGQDLPSLDRLAQRYLKSNKILASLEGAGCGFGGMALIAADIPLLLSISLRTIQQIGTCYGFNMKDPSMLPIVMNIFHAGTTTSVAVKTAAVVDMHIAAASLAGKTAFDALAKRTRTMYFAKKAMQYAGNVPSAIARNLTERKIAQMIPVIGAIIGAGFNYWFLSNVATAAYMMFRKLRIEASGLQNIESKKTTRWSFFRKSREKEYIHC